MDEQNKRYWFPAKHYGWGWGLPQTWQGWLVLAGFFGMILVALHFYPPNQNAPAFFALLAFSTVVFLLICLFKGEPPYWRWGGK